MSDSLWPMDCSPPGSSVHGILQARRLEWVAMPSSRGSLWSRDQTHISCTAGGSSPSKAQGKPSCHLRPQQSPRGGEMEMALQPWLFYRCKVKVTQSCPTICDPMDYTVNGILQARILECIAFPSPGVFPTQGLNPGPLNCRQILYQLSHQGSPAF